MKTKKEVMIVKASLKDYEESVKNALRLLEGILWACPKKEQVPIILYYVNKLLTEYFEKQNFKGVFYNEDHETTEYVIISRKDYDKLIKEIVKEEAKKKFFSCEERNKA